MSNLSIVTASVPALAHSEEDGLMNLAMTIAAIRASEQAAPVGLVPMTVIVGGGMTAQSPAAHGLRLL